MPKVVIPLGESILGIRQLNPQDLSSTRKSKDNLLTEENEEKFPNSSPLRNRTLNFTVKDKSLMNSPYK